MLRADSNNDIRALHLEGLERVFPRGHVRSSAPDDITGVVEVEVVVPLELNVSSSPAASSSSPPNGSATTASSPLASADASAAQPVSEATLYVTLPRDFPRVPPSITCAHAFSLRVAKDGSEWRPSVSVLAEAVAEAAAHLRALWGNLRPPTLSSVYPSLEGLSDETLTDIFVNPSATQSFAYQLPLAKSMRAEIKRLAETADRMANANDLLLRQVTAAESEVEDVHKSVKKLLEQLEPHRERLATAAASASTEGVFAMFQREAKQLQQASDDLDQRLQSLDLTNPQQRAQFESLRAEFLATRKELHLRELMRRGYVTLHR